MFFAAARVQSRLSFARQPQRLVTIAAARWQLGGIGSVRNI